ncbi:MAG: hypothetical protein V4581_14990 [Bacteroidota bacterium]
MKKLHITLIAFFVLFIAQAQTVTEKDLLGEWTPRKMTVQGTFIDFKTGDITFSPETQEEVEASGQDIEEVKNMVKEGLANGGMDKIKVIFKSGLAAEFHRPDSVKEVTYTLSVESGSTYMIRNDGKEMKVSLADGLLQIVPRGEEGEDAPSIYFEKKK